MYKAKVVKLSVKPHPNADRLKLGYAQGIQVVVGLDAEDGDIGAFFPQDGQLSQEFLYLHNLYRHSNLNADTSKVGYFSDNGRVTAEKLRGENSEGFWCPLSYFEYTGYDVSGLKLGDEFDTLNGHKICKKYYTPATKRAMSQRAKNKSLIDYNLPQHYDTEQLRYNLDKIEEGDLLTVTEKCHGTSTRIGNVQVTRSVKLNLWQRLFNLIPGLPKYPESITQYEFVVGTRRTIANERFSEGDNDYYRLELAKPLEGMLLPGEVIYAEIVGYDSNGGLIMNQQATTKLKDKAVKKQYGDVMQYTYGCAWNDLHKPQRKMYVYRITHVHNDIETDLSWQQVKGRCTQLGLETVPEIEGYVNNPIKFYGDTQEDYVKLLLSDLEEKELECPSLLDSSHIREGVVIRLEKASGKTIALKHKSFTFGILEGYLKQDDNYIDAEEIS